MKIVALALLAATLGGCAVYPAPVAVAPAPVYAAPAYPAYPAYYGGYGYWGPSVYFNYHGGRR
ncbi:hypothetical protein [Ralstonia flaminis]|jgi:hypothetical protein|uniref:Lipoprotein n=1 Tax=Ralstonia flaminis TaxID=3058597 RepID=A0ABN9JUB7_9RALS|nr:hypothetical protein [Ralstonia sp. LMG 18101]CAJ0820451.1 hypothetical protein LMG18101_04285 [Ralstonia sp. LMG 18101]